MGVGSRAQQARAPVFQQQDPEQIFLVIWLDLPLEDKPVQQLVKSHFSQGISLADPKGQYLQVVEG